MSHIFLSYSHKDLDYTEKLAEKLRGRDIEVWIDKDSIRAGEQWPLSIREAIQKSSAVLVIMTPTAEHSSWVREEIGVALAYRKRIFPLLLEGSAFSSLNDIQYRDVRGRQFPQEEFFDYLCGYIAGRASIEEHESGSSPSQTQTTSSSDILLLKKYWKYLKTDIFAQLEEDLPEGYLDRNFVTSMGDFRRMHARPENQLYDQDLENALRILDTSIGQLLNYTGTLFGPVVGDSKYTIHVTGCKADPETGFRIDPSARKTSYEMLKVAEKVLKNHRSFLQILQHKRLLHDIAWRNKDT